MKTHLPNSKLHDHMACHTFRWLRATLMLLFITNLSTLTLGQNKLWDRSFASSYNYKLTLFQQTTDGGYIVGGTSYSYDNWDSSDDPRAGDNYFVVKLNASGEKEWDRTLGGDGDDELVALQQTSDGGYILGGWSKSSGVGGDKTEANKGGCSNYCFYSDFWIVKLNGSGDKVWDRTLGGSGDDRLAALQQTSDGGYILGGTSNSGASGDKTEESRGGYDYWVVKLDPTGEKEWDKTLGGDDTDEMKAHNYDMVQSLQQTDDGGYILGGYSNSDNTGDKTEANKGNCYLDFCTGDYWVVKLDAAGDKEWDRTLGGFDDDDLKVVLQTVDGGYIVGGTSGSGISGDKTEANNGDCTFDIELFDVVCTKDYWVVKLNAAGDKEWDRAFGGSGEDILVSLQQTKNGGYILGGTSNSPISGNKTESNRSICYYDYVEGFPYPYVCPSDYWVVKLGAGGEKEWDRTLGGSDSDDLVALLQPDDGGYILVGTSYSSISGDRTQPNMGGQDYWVVKLIKEEMACDRVVQSFTLVNADLNQDILTLQEGDVLDLATLPTRNLKIRANVYPATAGSVVFDLQGKTAVENLSPYNYRIKGKFTPGSYTLSATPYCGTKGRGEKGTALRVNFQVVNQAVKSFTLVDAASGKDLQELANGDTIHLASLPSRSLNIRANTSQRNGIDVLFILEGQEFYSHTQWERGFPYTLFGNKGANYKAWHPTPGTYTLSASPFSDAGKLGGPLTITFTVTNGAAASITTSRLNKIEEDGNATIAYPNPTSDGRLKVAFSHQVQGEVIFHLYSSVGAELSGGVLPIATPLNEVELDLSRQLQTTGIYYLHLKGPNFKTVLKVVRQ